VWGVTTDLILKLKRVRFKETGKNIQSVYSMGK